MKHNLIFIPFLLFSIALFSQEDRVSELEVELQKQFLEANTLKLIGKYDDAVKLYQKVIERDRTNGAAYYEIARIQRINKQQIEATRNIELAVLHDSENIWFNQLQADIYNDSGLFDKAANVYDILVQKHPDETAFYYQWAYFLVKNGEPDKAMKVYNELEKKIGTDEELNRKKQVLYLSMDKPDKAIAEIEKLIKRFPYKIRYLHMLAGLYQSFDRKKEAKEVYARILESEPEDGESLLFLAEKFIKQGEFLRYLHAIGPVIQDENVGIDLKISKLFPFINVIVSSADQELKNKILQTAEDLTLAHPNDAKSFSIYGDLLSHADKEKEATLVFEQTLKLDQTVFTVWEQLFYLYESQSRFNDLLKSTEAALDIYPNKAKAHYFNGIAYAAKDNSQKAISAFEQAGIMSRNNPLLQLDVLHRLGKVYYKVKQYPRAVSKLEKTLSIGGEKIPDLLELLGDCQFQMGNIGDAVDYWKNAQEKGSKSGSLKKKIETKSLIE